MNETTSRVMLEVFFTAENQRDWKRYVAFPHREIEWVVVGLIVQCEDYYLDAIAAAFADSDAQFRLHQIIHSANHGDVATLLVEQFG